MNKIRLNSNTLYYSVSIITICSVLFVLLSEIGNVWLKGINYFSSNAEKYYNQSVPLEGEYSVTINLPNLESNEGKVLFNDGENEIIVSKVMKDAAHYQVYFRSIGKVQTSGATLVSGVVHEHNAKGLTSDLMATAETTYNNISYESNVAGYSGTNFRDGDEFGFYLLPRSVISLEEYPTVKVTVSNLHLQLWAKKPHL